MCYHDLNVVVAKSSKRDTKKRKEKVIDETPPSPSLSDATEMRGKNKKSKKSSRLKKRPRPAWEGKDKDEDEERDEGGYEDDNVAGGTTHMSIHDDEEAARIGEDLDHDREHSTHDREEDVYERGD